MMSTDSKTRVATTAPSTTTSPNSPSDGWHKEDNSIVVLGKIVEVFKDITGDLNIITEKYRDKYNVPALQEYIDQPASISR